MLIENTKAVIKKSSDEKEATITFEPDLEEQKRLVAIYAVSFNLYIYLPLSYL